jgi:hypothetical protein
MKAEFFKDIIKEQDESRYRQKLILSALRNLLAQNNPHKVNDYLIEILERENYK